MSTMIDQKPLTAAQRQARAAEQAAVHLDLDNAKLLAPILSEMAAEELRHNPAFAERVRAAYEAAAPKPKPTTQGKRVTPPAKPKVQLKPVKDIGIHQINIAAAVDPYFIYDVFGLEQLPLALDGFSKKKLLDEVVPFVQKRHPEARPKAKADKQGVIAFIVHHVVNG